jgi:hypothetical protein
VTGSQLENEATAQSILAALADTRPTWITLPEAATDVPDALQRAIEAFDAGDRPAACAATAWLKTKAVDAHKTSRTRLLIADQRVAGFYSLASAQVALQSRHRRDLGLQGVVSVPAALVTWIAKDARADIEGKALLLHATATARRAAALQAAALLVVDPFDKDTDQMWRERFGFRPSSEPGPLKRLWLPLSASA